MPTKFVKMVYGDSGEQVKKAQELLAKAGSSIKANGQFSIGMKTAVKNFQKKNGLAETGEIDAKTMKKLEEFDKPAKKTPAVKATKPVKVAKKSIAESYPVITPKTRLTGFIKELQMLLTKAGYKLPKTETEGTAFGAKTLAALKKFQKEHGLPVIAKCDKATWAELLRYE